MKKTIVLLIAMALLFSACSNGSVQTAQTAQPAQTTQAAQTPQPTQTASPPPSPQATAAEVLQEYESVAVLCADFSSGSPDGDIEEYDFGYSGDLTPEMLLDGLSELTGLDFAADVFWTEMGIVIYWKDESTLIANLDDRVPKEEFQFFDAVSMRWFMMDSLYRTLISNFDEDNVFYSMNDGDSALEFEDHYPVKIFPLQIPYQGSPFYYEHADGKGLVTNEDEAKVYLEDRLTQAGYDKGKTEVTADPHGGDPWFGAMAVWYFNLKTTGTGADAEDKYVAITYDWEVWEYDALEDEWSIWD